MAAAWQRVAALAVAGLLYISALLHGVEAQCGGFSKSCPFELMQFFPSTGYLTASCRTKSGTNVGTSINLNLYLGNDNGILRPGTNFLASCYTSDRLTRDPGSSSVLVTADCKSKQGNYVFSVYDVNRNIFNDNGNVKWNKCRRPALLESDDNVRDESTPEGAKKALFT